MPPIPPSAKPPPEKGWIPAGTVASIPTSQLALAGTEADLLRALYRAGTESIHAQAQGMLKSTGDLERAARFVSDARDKLKIQIREQGPELFKAVAEARNEAKVQDALGETYEQRFARKLAKLGSADKANAAIIDGVTDTSRVFNLAGTVMKVTAGVTQILLSGLENSPGSYGPLPKSKQEEIETEKSRLRYGIPADANIDRHGHQKRGSYLQVDVLDPHVADEIDQETEEILWALGVDITYNHNGVTWTVPGYPTPPDPWSPGRPLFPLPPPDPAWVRRLQEQRAHYYESNCQMLWIWQ